MCEKLKSEAEAKNVEQSIEALPVVPVIEAAVEAVEEMIDKSEGDWFDRI
jgi:hypothetical protein